MDVESPEVEEIPGAVVYGDSREEAKANVEALALEVTALQ